MKNLIILISLIVFGINIYAQQRCGTSAYTLQLINKYPEYKIEREKVNINFTLLWNSPMNTSIDVFYNQSRYELKPIEKFTFYDEMEIIEPNEDVHIRRYIPKPKDEHFINPGEFKPGFYDQAKAFKDFVLTNKIDNKFAKIEDAFFAQKLANEMSESYE